MWRSLEYTCIKINKNSDIGIFIDFNTSIFQTTPHYVVYYSIGLTGYHNSI